MNIIPGINDNPYGPPLPTFSESYVPISLFDIQPIYFRGPIIPGINKRFNVSKYNYCDDKKNKIGKIPSRNYSDEDPVTMTKWDTINYFVVELDKKETDKLVYRHCVNGEYEMINMIDNSYRQYDKKYYKFTLPWVFYVEETDWKIIKENIERHRFSGCYVRVVFGKKIKVNDLDIYLLEKIKIKKKPN